MDSSSQTTPDPIREDGKEISPAKGQDPTLLERGEQGAKEDSCGKKLQVDLSPTEYKRLLEQFGGCLCDVGRMMWNPETNEYSPNYDLTSLCPIHNKSKNPLGDHQESNSHHSNLQTLPHRGIS